MEEEYFNEFDDMENAVVNYSRAYADSRAFAKALSYIKTHDYELYKKLIHLECEDMGYFV